MFGRSSKTVNDQQTDDTLADRPEREGAKNRPTPRRRDQEAARKRPLVESDRKAARSTDKAKRREHAAKVREAMTTGNDQYLPARDKGPVRRYIRDHVDARWNLGEFMLPVMLLVLLLSFVRTLWAVNLAILLVYGLLLLAAGDAFLMWRGLKRKLAAKFGADRVERGVRWYAFMRMIQMRVLRLPKPQVKRGQYPV